MRLDYKRSARSADIDPARALNCTRNAKTASTLRQHDFSGNVHPAWAI